jgi:hypothetical protein
VGVAIRTDAVEGCSAVPEAQLKLAEALAGRNCLLILDDVWEPDVVEALHTAAGENVRILLTSRKRGMFASAGVHEVRLDELSEEEALQMLSGWTGVPFDALPPEAVEISRECGKLPLAVAMIGGLIRAGGDWAHGLARLRSGDLTKLGPRPAQYAHETLDRAMQVSFEDLEPMHRARYLDFVAVPENDATPGAMMRRWWTHEGMGALNATDLLDALVARSLVRADDRDMYSLHSVQRDFLARRVHETPALHARWLAAFIPTAPRSWLDAKDDGYLFGHLAYHLAGAEQEARLNALICADWRSARAGGNGFVHAGFLADVDAAERFAASRPSPDLAQLVRLRMVRECTLANPRACDDDELVVLVRGDRQHEAMAYARLRPTASERAWSLLAVARASEGAEQDGALLDEILRETRRIVATFDRTHALTRLLSFLAADVQRARRDRVLEEIVTATRAFDDDSRFDLLRRRVVEWLVEAAELDTAVALAGELREPAEYVTMHCVLARALLKRDRSRSQQLLEQAILRVDENTLATTPRLVSTIAQAWQEIGPREVVPSILTRAKWLFEWGQEDLRRSRAVLSSLRESLAVPEHPLAETDSALASPAASRRLASPREEPTDQTHHAAWESAQRDTLEGLASAGYEALALQLLAECEAPYGFSPHGLVRALIAQGLLDEAARVAPASDFAVAVALTLAGDERGSQRFRAIEDSIEASASEPHRTRRQQGWLARAYIEANRWDDARRILALQRPSEDVSSLLRAERTRVSVATFSAASALAPVLALLENREHGSQVRLLLSLTDRLAELDRLDEAALVAERMSALEQEHAHDGYRCEALCSLALGHGRRGDPPLACSLLQEAETCAHDRANSELMRDIALSNVARVYGRLGHFGTASRFSEQIHARDLRVELLGDLARIARLDQDQCNAFFEAAELELAQVESPERTSIELGKRCLQAGQTKRAFSILPQLGFAEFWCFLLNCSVEIEALAPNRFPRVLAEAAEVAGWDRPEWAELARKLRAHGPKRRVSTPRGQEPRHRWW